MRSAVVKLLGNRKSFYLSCVAGSGCLVLSLALIFFTDSSLGLIGLFMISSVLLYTFSLISCVWNDRRSSTLLVRESRALRAQIAERDKVASADLTDNHKELLQSIERLEKNLEAALNEYQKNYLEQLKTQAFNSHLAVQELKSVIFSERDHNG